jgi:chloramphenicol 3-O phosphotransferase
MMKGQIIFLNGVSSSGKTTLAKALQEKLPEPFYRLEGDAFVSMLPEKYISSGDKQLLEKTFEYYYQAIRAFSDAGAGVIADHVFNKSLTPYDKCLSLLCDRPVLFVHVTCPLKELRCREKERGDRPVGCAEYLLSVLWPEGPYDVTVDTQHETLEECVDKIIAALSKPADFSAFKTLRSQRSGSVVRGDGDTKWC